MPKHEADTPLNDSEFVDRPVNANPQGRWTRLFYQIVWFGGLFAMTSLIGNYVLDHGFSMAGLTDDQLMSRLRKALVMGLFFGVVMGFPTWLALEKFDRRKTKPRQ